MGIKQNLVHLGKCIALLWAVLLGCGLVSLAIEELANIIIPMDVVTAYVALGIAILAYMEKS